jgi:peptide/nickel transport system substrate-binding protein
LLSSHGWHIVANGTTTCTNGAKCGAGIKTGTKLQLSLNYPTALPQINSEFEAFQSAARSLGIQLTLAPTEYVQFSAMLGPCTTSNSNCWEMGSWGGSGFYYFNQFPDGGGPFEGAAFAYTDPGSSQVPGVAMLDNLIAKVRVTSTTAAIESALHSYSTYASKLLPVLWLPEEYYQISLIKKGLTGVNPQNALGTITPELWRLSS